MLIMMNILKYRWCAKLYNRPVVLFILLWLVHILLILSVLAKHDLSTNIFGWDGVDHYSMAVNYYNNIFPKAFGWVGRHFTGYIWPLSYNPLYTYSVSLIFSLFQSSILTFNFFNVFLFLIQPVLVYFSAKRVGFSTGGILLAVGLFILYQTSVFPSSAWNGSFIGVFFVGLYPHLIAQVLLLLWFGFFYSPKTRKLDTLLAGVLSPLIFLSNTHVGLFVFVLISITALKKIMNKDYRGFALMAFFLFTTVGIASFWILPSLVASGFLMQQTISQVYVLDIVLFVVNVPVIFQLRKSVRHKEHLSKCLEVYILIFSSSFFAFLLSVFPLASYWDSLPVHGFRIFTAGIPLLVICSAEIISIHLFSRSFKRTRILSLTYPVCLILSSSLFIHGANNFVYSPRACENYIGSRILAEHGSYMDQSLSAQVPLCSEGESMWNLYKNSTPNSLVVTYLRNVFSYDPENVGVVCKGLCLRNYYSIYKDSSNFSSQLNLLSVDTFVASNDSTKDILSRIGYREVGETTDLSFYEVPQEKSINDKIGLTAYFSNGFPKHSDWYDWPRWNLLWFMQGDFSRFFVNPRELRLDKTSDLKDYNSAVISSYKYHDLNKAVSNLANFAKTNTLILIYDPSNPNDVVAFFLRNNNSYPNIQLVAKRQSPQMVYDEVLALLKEESEADYTLDDTPVTMNISEYDSMKFVYKLSSANKTYYLSKYSYSPFLKEVHGAPTNMISPGFLLVEDPGLGNLPSLKVDLSPYDKISWLISLSSFFLLVVFVLTRKTEKNDNVET